MPDIGTLIRGYACDAVADCHADRIIDVRRFPTGENHAVYKLTYLVATGDPRSVVIRVSLGTHPEECEQAEREARVLAQMHSRYAPQLYDFRRTSSWFDRPVGCTEFIDGETKDMTSASAEDMHNLGSAVGWLHRLPADGLSGWMDRSASMAEYLDSRLSDITDRLPLVCDPLPAAVQGGLHRAWAAIQGLLDRAHAGDSFAPDETLVLLHGDVGAGNILWTPMPVLIDWEYARFGDPADEVAYIFSQNELNGEQRKAFWLGYRECSLSEQHLDSISERVLWWEPTTLLGSSLWWVELFARRADADAAGRDEPATPRGQSYYLERVTRRIDRLDELLGDRAK